ncbi:MAG: hypothetical protein R2766_10115 [Saprospiraceae bacterium]
MSFYPTTIFKIDTILCEGNSFEIELQVFFYREGNIAFISDSPSFYGCDSIVELTISFEPCDTIGCSFIANDDG